MRVTFVEVSGDSRCPIDAICIQGGSATVRILVGSGFSNQAYELQTGDMQPIVHAGLTVALVELSPYPFSARPIAPDEYRRDPEGHPLASYFFLSGTAASAARCNSARHHESDPARCAWLMPMTMTSVASTVPPSSTRVEYLTSRGASVRRPGAT